MTFLRHLLSPDGRRAGAFLVVLGGAVVMTLYAAAVLCLVAGNARYAFYLGMAAHIHILLALTAVSALLVKRTLKVGKDGITIEDDGE